MPNKNFPARIGLFLVLLISSFLAACGSDSSNPATSQPQATTAPATAAVQANAAPTATGYAPGTNPQAAVTTLPATSTTVAPTTVAATNTPLPTATPVPPTATATPAPTKAPELPRFIEALRNRSYNGGEIKLDRLYSRTNVYTANLIYYQSDGLKISGLMFVPNGPAGKKYPVALVNHGYFNPTPADYDSGWDTLRELMFFANNGYITIASDYRNYARSDKGDNDREPGYVVDILNLIDAVKKFPQADPSKITIMGHSMGGEITQTVMVVNPDIKVAALFGTMSPDTVDNYYARINWNGGRPNQKWNETYGTPESNPTAYRLMSPLTYFKDVKVPVIIHIGSNDTTTPPAWSVKTRDALQAAGKKVEFYSYQGQGHSLNGTAFDQAMQRTLAFFNAALKS